MKVTIGRPINGITINGNEYILNDDGSVREFENEEAAKQFLRENGAADDEMEFFSFEPVVDLVQ